MLLALYSKLFLPFLLFLWSCSVGPKGHVEGYDMEKAALHLTLPDSLREISGHTEINDHTFACVEDEHGIIYFYDLSLQKVVRQLRFAENGDYEGITRVGKTLYVLRSDGVIFEVEHHEREQPAINTYTTHVPAKDNEGLCYDKAGNRLLIGSKSKPGKGAEYKNIRAVFAFDLNTKTISRDPAYAFDVESTIDFVLSQKIVLPIKPAKGKKPERPILHFGTSDISIHPQTGDLFLLSAVDHMLFVFDQQSKAKNVVALDQVVFNKAEGIAFLDNGDMVISNEGQDLKPSLLLFKFNP